MFVAPFRQRSKLCHIPGLFWFSARELGIQNDLKLGRIEHIQTQTVHYEDRRDTPTEKAFMRHLVCGTADLQAIRHMYVCACVRARVCRHWELGKELILNYCFRSSYIEFNSRKNAYFAKRDGGEGVDAFNATTIAV